MRDIEIIKRELPLDLLEFFFPDRRVHTDLSMMPVGQDNLEDMEMVSGTSGGIEALEKSRRMKELGSAARQEAAETVAS